MKCVIPAAGRGVRFNELGRHYPKCVLPYKDVPIIAHNIKLALEAGASEVCVVVGHRGEKIREIVAMYFPDDERIIFEEYQMHDGKDGPAMSIWCGVPFGISEPLLVLLSDIVIKELPPLDESWISTQTVPDWERWCMAEVVSGQIVEFHDKPVDRPPTDQAVSGVYYFKNGAVFENCLKMAIDDNTEGEVQISHAMNHYMEDDTISTRNLEIVDFGTLHEYLENRGISNSREFNSVFPIGNSLIHKQSEKNPEKIHIEVNWYENLPTPIKIMTPRVFGTNLYDEIPGYSMERIDSPTARELFLYLESEPSFWTDFYSRLFDTVEQFSEYKKPGKSTFFSNLDKKNRERVAAISDDLRDNDAIDFCDAFDEMQERGDFDIFQDSLFHGDLCFSNIFYHPGSKHIKLIDPRGDAYGNVLYDLAKITHSAYFPYDYIDAELYLKREGETIIFDAGKHYCRKAYKKLFIERFGEDTWQKTLTIVASLFLTMIPLHSHNRNNQELFYDTFRKASSESGLLG